MNKPSLERVRLWGGPANGRSEMVNPKLERYSFPVYPHEWRPVSYFEPYDIVIYKRFHGAYVEQTLLDEIQPHDIYDVLVYLAARPLVCEKCLTPNTPSKQSH